MPRLSPRSSSRTPATGRKNRLFCPSCGHASPTDGDWRTLATASGVVYTCPVCDAEVTTRQSDRHARPTVTSASAGSTLVGRSIRVALAWTAWPYPYRPGSADARRHP